MQVMNGVLTDVEDKDIMNGTFIFPEGVTSIGDYAFDHCKSLISIIIPEGVTSIGDYAFASCRSLTSINLPEGVTSIGDYAFFHCSHLTSITIPEGVTSIGACAFYDCISLTSITIPEGVTSIGYSAFWNCNPLTSITLPESITNIEKSAFDDCSIKEFHTPWGSCVMGDCTTKDIIQKYLYLYANSILKEKYLSFDDFLSSNDFIYEFFDGAIIYHTNAIIKFKNLFYKMRKDFDIPNGLFNRMSVEMTEKFDLKTWNRIKNIFDWRGSPEMTEAFNEIIAVFGLFEEDNEKEKRILDFIDLFQRKSYIITNDDYFRMDDNIHPYFEKIETTCMLLKEKTDILTKFQLYLKRRLSESEIKKIKKLNGTYGKQINEFLKEKTDISTQFQPYLKRRLSESEIRKIKKLTGTYGKQINEFLKDYYQVSMVKDYQLKEEYLNQKDIKKYLFFKTDLHGYLTYHSLHRIFDGCELTFQPDFYHFFMDNLEFILQDEKLQSQVKNIQKNFEKMKKHYLFQSGIEEITLKQALDYLENITFDYHDGNYELALDVKRAGVKNEEAFLYYQKLFEENDVRKLSSLIKRSHIYEIDGYTIQAELLRKDDSFGMLVGETNYTNCCQAFGGIGHNCMAHAVSSDDGGIFVTRLLKDGEWILLTESWDWQNNNIYCHDNIEGTPYFKKDERLKKAVAEVYRLDGEAIIEKSKEEVLKYIKTRRKVIEKSSLPNKEKELELLRELEQREVIRLVTVGSGNDDLGLSRYFQRSIQVNQEQIIHSQRFTLENFQPVNYHSNQPYFDNSYSAYTDSNIKQYMIAGSIEELCLGKQEPLVPIYRDERRVILEEKKNIRNYTIKKIKDMEKEIYPKEMYQYQTSHQDDFSDSNIYLGEDWYLIYEEKEDNGIYISDLVKTTPTLGDELKDQNQEIMKVIYDLVRKYDYIEADLKEDSSYLLYLINKKLGYFEQIGEDISYPFQNRNQQKEITEQEQENILKQMKEIKKKKNPDLIMHHITFQKGKLFQLEEEAIKHR